MKTMIFAAIGVLVLTTGAASAQGGAGASPAAYGQQWAEIHRAKCQNAKQSNRPAGLGTAVVVSRKGGGNRDGT
jgi:hypothetical protein